MTGFDEAEQWLRKNAPEWRIERSTSSLEASFQVGGPTMLSVEVTLMRQDATTGYDVWLVGTGGSHMEAVQNAVGGLRPHAATA